MAKKLTQHQKLLNHFEKSGTITNREAMIDYSIQSLTKRIQELRELGYNIVSNKRNHPTTGQRYVRYVFLKSYTWQAL